MNFHQECLICHSADLKYLSKYSQNYLVKCNNCGFIFASKIPTTEELTQYYNNYNRQAYISPITIMRYNELLDIFERYRKTSNILDIGCGVGYFLEEAKKRNWNVYGTEYSDQAVNICTEKRLNVKKGTTSSINFDKDFFDIITSFEVIEHINNPLEEIQSIYNILRVDGIFYLTTPNINSITRLLLKDKWNVINYPEHLCYYSTKTLHYLLKKNNFQKISLKTTGISISRFRNSKHTSNNPLIAPHSDDEIIRVKSENIKIFKLLIKITNHILSLLAIGDNIKALYQKNK